MILERNETCLARNETRLERNETRLARNETRGGNLPLSGTVDKCGFFLTNGIVALIVSCTAITSKFKICSFPNQTFNLAESSKQTKI